MTKLFRYSFVIYLLLLILAIPLSLIAKFMIGAAGHYRPYNVTDYLLLGYEIVTAILLSVFLQKNGGNIVRILLLLLITIALLLLLYGLYELISELRSFYSEELIPVIILLFLITLTSVVWIGLFKSKIEK